MVEQGQLVLTGIQFSLNPSGAGPQLQLGSHAQRRGKAALNASRGGVATTVGCSFSTGGSSKALVGKSAQRRARASPFASISMALPFAAATVSKPAVAPADGAKKKKKSIPEILENAGKKALSGGIPGMVAMALQVLSLMWLR